MEGGKPRQAQKSSVIALEKLESEGRLAKAQDDCQKIKFRYYQEQEWMIEHLYNLQMFFPTPYFDRLKGANFLPIHDWAYVLSVTYKTFDDTRCPICLTEYYEMVSPHMAFCGHIFVCRASSDTSGTVEVTLPPDKYCPMCKDEVMKTMLKFTRFDIIEKLKPGDTIVLDLMKQNPLTKRFEVLSNQGLVAEESKMIRCVAASTFITQMENEMAGLLHFQESNAENPDMEMSAAVNECVEFLSSRGMEYFDSKLANAYFDQDGNRITLGQAPSLDTISQRKKSHKQVQKEVVFYQDRDGSNTYLHWLCQDFLEYQHSKEEEYMVKPQATSGPPTADKDQSSSRTLDLNSLPRCIKGTVVEVVQTNQSRNLRKIAKSLKHLPDNTELRLVMVRMDELLDKDLLHEYLQELSIFKKKERLKQTIDEAKAKKIYSKTRERARDAQPADQDSEFILRDNKYLPAHIERNLETVESFEKNKDNPEFYPKLDPGELPKGAKIIDFPTEIITTKTKLAVHMTQETLNKDRQKQLDVMKGMRPDGYGQDGDFDEPPEGGFVIFTKGKSKKNKKGK